MAILSNPSHYDVFIGQDKINQTDTYSNLGVLNQESRKCMDNEVPTQYCTACKRWEGRDRSSSQYAEWKAGHGCLINHRVSSLSMETADALRVHVHKSFRPRLHGIA